MSVWPRLVKEMGDEFCDALIEAIDRELGTSEDSSNEAEFDVKSKPDLSPMQCRLVDAWKGHHTREKHNTPFHLCQCGREISHLV